ncbi:hypothetical protein BGX38DRAFT_1267762 [Terfezia claveryi]|nr:hypothetical protein BGX38DRAFT_1267762 [Terfezia claveryi]
MGQEQNVLREGSGETRKGVDSGNPIVTPASTRAFGRSNGESISATPVRQETALSYVQRARALQYRDSLWPSVSGPSNQGGRSFTFNPAAPEFIPSLTSSTVSTPIILNGGLITTTEGHHISSSLGTNILTFPIMMDSYLFPIIAIGVAPISIGYSIIPLLAPQPPTFVPWSAVETAEGNSIQGSRDLTSEGNMGRQIHQQTAETMADTPGSGAHDITDYLGNFAMGDPTSEADQDEDPVIRDNNRKRKGKEVVRDQEGDADNVSKKSNHAMWNKERPGENYTSIENTHYLNHFGNTLNSHYMGHPSSPKVETGTIRGSYTHQSSSSVVEKKSLANRMSTASFAVHKSAGRLPVPGLPEKMTPARLGQMATKNGGLMRSIWQGQGWAMAQQMGREGWVKSWKEVGGGKHQEEFLEDRDIGPNDLDLEEHWTVYEWTDEDWDARGESMDGEAVTQNKQGEQTGVEDDDEDDDETSDERDKRLEEVMAGMGLIELRRMVPGPFQFTGDEDCTPVADEDNLEAGDGDDVLGGVWSNNGEEDELAKQH